VVSACLDDAGVTYHRDTINGVDGSMDKNIGSVESGHFRGVDGVTSLVGPLLRFGVGGRHVGDKLASLSLSSVQAGAKILKTSVSCCKGAVEGKELKLGENPVLLDL